MKADIALETNDRRTSTVEVSDTTNDSDSSSIYFCDAFKWMNNILYYSPMWITTTADKKSRNTVLNYFGSAISIGFVFLYCVCQYYFQITGWYIYTDIDNSIWCGYVAFVCLSRLLSIMYCNKYFNWSWKSESLPFQYQPFTSEMKRDIIRCKILYISFAICYVVVDIIVLYLETDALLEYYNNLATYILMKSMCRLFLLYPQLISTIIQSIIILKYHLYLNELYNKLLLNTSETDLKGIFKHYENIYKSFKREYHWSLGISVKLFLFAEVLFFWDSFNFIGLWVMLLIAIRILPVFMLYFYTASILADMYTITENELWQNGYIYLNNKENKHDTAFYNYILHYIQKYPVYLEFGPVIISKINVIKFSIGLIITRALSHVIRQWVEENY